MLGRGSVAAVATVAAVRSDESGAQGYLASPDRASPGEPEPKTSFFNYSFSPAKRGAR